MCFFNDTATTEIYTLSLHDALPISADVRRAPLATGHLAHHGQLELAAVGSSGHRVPPLRMLSLAHREKLACLVVWSLGAVHADRKSTRLNSSHANISYAVFCLKKKT